jgi:hypothetical protein
MLADLDLLLTAVFCTADDFLPARPKNARRIDSDREFLAIAHKRLSHLSRSCPSSRATSSAGAGWPRRSTGCAGSSCRIAPAEGDRSRGRALRRAGRDGLRGGEAESAFWTLKDRLGLERHRARTRALGRPTRAFADLAV